MNMCGSIILAVMVVFGASGAVSGDLPTLEQVLDRYVEELGGREAIAKLTTRTVVGKQIDDRPYQGPPVESELEAWADTTGRWAMVLSGDDGETREDCDGDKNTKLAFIFNPQAILDPEKYFPNLRLTGTWEYEDKQYFKVENDLQFEYYTLYFEVETGMLTRIGYHWWLEDFREVDGVLVPFTVVRGRKGGSTNLYFETVTHNAEVADHLEPGGQTD